MAALFKYPLTRQDALAYANRYADIISRPAARIDSHYSYCRLPRDPEYSEAAGWPGFAEEFWPQISARILPIFQRISPELEHWLFEYVQQQWPELFYRPPPGSRTASSLLDLMRATGDRTVRPLHIAAALGLSKLCQSLIESGADVDHLSSLGTPLYCALLGPITFQREVTSETESTVDIVAMAAAPCSSISQEATLRVLLDAGAIGLNVSRPMFTETFSVQTFAFLTFMRLRSWELFERLYPPPMDRLNLEDDPVFRAFVGNEAFKKLPLARDRSSALEEFIDAALLVAFDAHLARFDHVPDFLDDLWDIISLRVPAATQLSSVRPLKNFEDGDYADFAKTVMQDGHEVTIRRLAQDPRWNPSWELVEPDGTRCSFLHRAVADGSADTVSVLLQTGANVHAQDSEGRTPVLLVETVRLLKLLTKHGAKLSAVDNKCQNIWHLAAANNDCPLLDWLVTNDQDMNDNLKVRMLEGGRTPVVQAIVYPLVQLRNREKINEKSSQKSTKEILEECLRAAMTLLLHCPGQKEYVQSDQPLLSHAAVEWGNEHLLHMLRACGASLGEVDDQGNSPLHQLNFSATKDMLATLHPECARLSLFNRDGLSPLETIFFNTFRQGSPLAIWGGKMTAHPAFSQSLDKDTYAKLVSMLIGNGQQQQKQAARRQCWERFVEHIILRWAIEELDSSLYESALEAVQCLVSAGCVEASETLGKGPAVLQLADVLLERECHTSDSRWHQLVLSIMAYVSPSLQDSPHLLIVFSDNRAKVQAILCWIVAYAGETYPSAALEHLIRDVFPIPTHLDKEPTMLYVCRSRCSPTVFKLFAQTAPPLTEPADIRAAREQFQTTNDADAKLRYFREAHPLTHYYV